MNTADSGIQINEKLIKLVNTKFAEQSVLIISTNKILRTNLKKVFVLFGFPLDRIGVTDTFHTAKEIITEHKPAIIISSFIIDEEFGSIDLKELHRRNYPDTTDNIFIALTDNPAHYMRTYKFEHGYDEVFKGEQSLQGYSNGLQSVFIQKVQIKPKEKLVNTIETLINEGHYNKAIEKLSKIESELNDLINFSLLGDIYYHQDNYEKSLEAYKFILEEDPINFKALSKSIKILNALGDHQKAKEYIENFLEHYECIPENLITFMKICNKAGDFNKTVFLGEQYADDPLISKEDKISLVELLQEASKEMFEHDPDKAVDIILSTIKISGGNNFDVFSNAVDILVKTRDHKAKAQDLYSKYYSNFSDEIEIDLVEYKAYYSSRSHAENFKLGMELYNKKFKSHFLFYTLIITGIEIGRSPDTLEDIVYGAIKVFPDFKANYQALLSKINNSTVTS